MIKLVGLVERAGNEHWDLGSNPRSPKTLFIFLLQVFPCDVQRVDHYALADLEGYVACKTDPMV